MTMAQGIADLASALQWNDKYVLGVPEIDAQHRGFLAMANAFLAVTASGQVDKETLDAALANLTAYGQQHFPLEEALIERVGLPQQERERHIDSHNDFIYRVGELAHSLRRGDKKIVRKMVGFMCDWFVKHLTQFDAKYANLEHSIDAEQLKAAVELAELPEHELEGMHLTPVGRLPGANVVTSAQRLAVPKQIGAYRLLDRLGEGATGEVYKAVHDTLERPAAIKLMAPEMAASRENVERFLREARVVSSLRHPNIVLVFDAGEAEGRYYIAMELIEGESLASHLEKKGALKEDEALMLLSQSLMGLDAAHAKGLVHRDIKPENMLLDKKGRLHIADFGLVMEASTKTSLTVSGKVMGTPQYISPELADGEKADVRCDIYSLGVTFYEALTGELPFKAPTAMSLLFKHKYQKPTPPNKLRPDLSDGVNRLILWMMGKQPEHRPKSAEAVLQMIAALRRGEKIPPPPTPKLPVQSNA
jgi:hemerythrin-like metal-binding protein